MPVPPLSRIKGFDYPTKLYQIYKPKCTQFNYHMRYAIKLNDFLTNFWNITMSNVISKNEFKCVFLKNPFPKWSALHFLYE